MMRGRKVGRPSMPKREGSEKESSGQGKGGLGALFFEGKGGLASEEGD